MTENWDVDFACLIARLRQIRDVGPNSDLGQYLLINRVLECDLPRMETYCTTEQWLMIVEAEQ